MPRDIEAHALTPELLLIKVWDNCFHLSQALSAPSQTSLH